jgi:hypothetical protein
LRERIAAPAAAEFAEAHRRPPHRMPMPEPARELSRNPLRRLVWLLVCIAVGLVVAIAGSLLAGSSWWALAVPVSIAIGWLFVADPTQCMPDRRSERRPSDESDRGVGES